MHRKPGSQICRDQAQANNRNFRSLTFPVKYFSVGQGFALASHFDSVMASFLSKQQIHDPTTARMFAALDQLSGEAETGAPGQGGTSPGCRQ